MRNIPRKYFRLFGTVATLCLLSALLATVSFAQGKQDFTLHNETGVEIYSLYVSPHKADNWEEDVLGVDTLPSGESVDITFSREEKAKLWDLRIEDKEHNYIEWESLNLLEISEVTLHYNAKTARAWADVK